MKHTLLGVALFLFLPAVGVTEPVKIIFDTDIGYDIDDTMALALAHTLADRGELEILAVTCTHKSPYIAPFVSLINTFYGRPDILIGEKKAGGDFPGGYHRPILEMKRPDGKPLFPRKIDIGQPQPEAVEVLRRVLADAEEGSVVLVQVGAFTNLARLLDSPADDISPYTGKELIEKKVKFASIMAGDFVGNERFRETNIHLDLAATKRVFEAWPTEIVFSGHEIGYAAPYPAQSMIDDFNYVPHHPVKEGYAIHCGFEHHKPTWDLNSVLYVARPNRGYYTLSEPGRATINDNGATLFTPEPGGKHRHQKFVGTQWAVTREAFVNLLSTPPKHTARSE